MNFPRHIRIPLLASALASLMLYLFSLQLFAETLPSKTDSAICVGLDADLSAVAKEGGIAIQRGLTLAINELNKSGGVLGKKINLISKDHRGNPVRGVDNISDLVQKENCIAIFGGVHTPVVLNELQTIHDLKVPFLIAWAAGTPVVDNGYTPNYVFRLSVRDQWAGDFILKNIKDDGIKKITLILERTGWGRSNERSMTKAAEKYGLEIASIKWVHWGQKDVGEITQTLSSSKSEAAVLVANAPEGATVFKAIANSPELKDLKIYSHWGITGGNFVEQVTLPVLNSLDIQVLQTFTFEGKSYNPKVQKGVFDRYRAHFMAEATPSTVPSAVGVAHAYDLMMILAAAIEKTNSLEGEAIRSALETIETYAGLLKRYEPPFSAERHEALNSSDYIMTQYSDTGYLIKKD